MQFIKYTPYNSFGVSERVNAEHISRILPGEGGTTVMFIRSGERLDACESPDEIFQRIEEARAPVDIKVIQSHQRLKEAVRDLLEAGVPHNSYGQCWYCKSSKGHVAAECELEKLRKGYFNEAD